MGQLSSKGRKALPGFKFGLPKSRKYPMEDKGHAANAKARASEEEKKGDLSKSAEAEIDARANAVLGK